MLNRIYTYISVILVTSFGLTQFNPEVSFELSNPYDDFSSDLTFTVTQPVHDIDMQSFTITSDAGAFDISNWQVGDIIGSGTGTFDYSGATVVDISLTVFNIPDANTVEAVATITASNSAEYPVGSNSGGVILSVLPGGGVGIEVVSPGDGETSTQGYTSSLTIVDFLIPNDVGSITFSGVYNSDLGDVVNLSSTVDITEFSPTISFAWGNDSAGEESDFTFTVVQDPQEIDLQELLIEGDGGSFLVGSILQGQVIGSGSSLLDGGATLVYYEVTASNFPDPNTVEAIATITASNSPEYNVGESAGGFVIANTVGGFSINSVSPGDPGLTTAGYTSNLTLSGIFRNPDASVINITSTLTSEVNTVEVFYDAIPLFVYDCNGDVNGTAFLDDCGECVGGATGMTENWAMDCSGECFGTAVIDNCGECTGGNTGVEFDASDLGCGCGAAAPVNYCSDWDGDGLGDPVSKVSLCETDVVPDGYVAECTDPYDDGETLIFFESFDNTQSGVGELVVGYTSDVDVYGFQFTVSGVTLIEGGAFSDVFTVSSSAATGNVIGFSLSGDFLPAGTGILTTLHYEYGPASTACLSNPIISGAPGHEPYATVGGCLDIPEPTTDCAGVYNGDSYVDDCGVCDNDPANDNADDLGCGCFEPAPSDFYWDADGDGLGAGEPNQFCTAPEGWVADNTDTEPDCATNDTDDCGVCGGGNAGLDNDGNCCEPSDIDDCGLCYGDGSSCNAPVAVDQSAATDENLEVSFDLDVTDPNNDVFTGFNLISGPSNGSVNATLGATVNVTYTPNPGFYGTDAFVYSVSDGMYDSNEATVSITVSEVDDTPVALSHNLEIMEDESTIIPLTGYDNDTPDSELQFTVTVPPTHGTLQPYGRAFSLMVYSPDQDFNGFDSFQYTVTDNNTTSDPATVSITINPVNDIPSITGQAVLATDEDTSLAITLADLTVSDPDNTYPDDFTLSVFPGSNYTVLNNTITPDPDFYGELTVLVYVYDGADNSNGFDLTVTVNGLNDDPVANNDYYSTDEDVGLFVDPIQGVLFNDEDVDMDALTVSLDQNVASGVLSLGIDGQFTYVPDNNFFGVDGFTYILSDNNGGTATGTVTINVNPVNDQPVAENLSFDLTGSDPTNYQFSVSVIDPDAESFPTINFAPFSQPMFGGLITPDVADGVYYYDKASNNAPFDLIFYRANDGITESNTAVIIFENIPGSLRSFSRALTAHDDDVTISEDQVSSITLIATDFDTDITGATVTLSDAANGSLGTPVKDDGVSDANLQVWTVDYTPDANYTGTDSFTFTVNGSATGTISITVNNVNDAPVIDAIADHSTDEGVEYTYDVNATDIDVSDVITYSLVSAPAGMNIDGASGIISGWTPGNGDVGDHIITVRATDDGTVPGPLSADLSYVLTVNNVNDIPVIDGQIALSTVEDTDITITLADLQVTDADNAYPNDFTLTLYAGDNYTFSGGTVTPALNYFGTLTVPVSVNDGTAESATFNLSIDVTAANDAPTMASIADPDPVDEDDANIVLSVTPEDVDPGDNLTVSVSVSNAALFPDGSFTVDVATDVSGVARTITLDPAQDKFGTSVVVISVSDGQEVTSIQVNVTVNAVNDTPVLSAVGDQVTDEDTPFSIDLIATDVDNALSDLQYSVTGGGASTIVASVSGNTVTFTPAADYFGSQSFNIAVADLDFAFDLEAITVTVNPVNDSPQITSTAGTIARTSEEYSYQVTATDVDDVDLFYSLTNAPAGMTISETGLITWSPQLGTFTSGTVTLTVSDGEGATATELFTITVYQVDCAGVDNGTAFIDDCGVCSGGTTDHDANSDKDCNGECFGTAVIDDCGECVGGSTGMDQNWAMDCAGICFGDAVVDNCGVCSGGTTTHVADSDIDCNGDCFGTAIVDDCGVCSEGNTGLVANADKDCNDECFGTAYIDDCGVCAEGSTGLTANADDLGCGCNEPAPVSYCSDADSDGYGDPASETQYCEADVPAGWVTDCTDSTPNGGVYFSYGDVDISGTEFATVDINYSSNVTLHSVLLNISNLPFTDVALGADLTGLGVNVSDNDIYVYTLNGIDFLDPGVGTLVTLSFSYDYLDAVQSCITALDVLLPTFGTPDVTIGDCINVDQPPYDCFDVPNGTAVEDACGVCDGPGLSTYCEDADSDGLGAGVSQDYCPEGTPGYDVPAGWVGNCDDVCPNDADNDIDTDGVCGDVDNCPADANADQADADTDGLGDVCDACVNDPDNDADTDGICGDVDNCPDDANADQADNDTDGTGDVCDTDDDNDGVADVDDNCVFTANTDQADNDTDGAGDVCDTDDDNDGVADVDDNCAFDANADQADNDTDGAGDACDTDDDNDGVADVDDNCPFIDNPDQADNEGDGVGDACDDDADNDTVLDDVDNCPFDSNVDQADNDSDGAGDACDADDDNDGVADVDDNCVFDANADQADNDTDGSGDVCDADDDNDGVADVDDNCQFISNPDQADYDADGLGDVCDDSASGYVEISFGNYDVNSDAVTATIEILYNSNVPINYFAFSVSNLSLNGNGVSDMTNLSIDPATGHVVGIGTTLPLGSGVLATLEFDMTQTFTDAADPGELVTSCFNNTVFTVISARAVPDIIIGDCIDVAEPPAGCDDVYNSGLELDVCGVCDGPGLSAFCEDTDSDGLGFGTSQEYCPEGTPGFDVPAGWVGNCEDTCPNDPDNDIDGDTVCGDVDNCPNDANTDQANYDGDTQGDVCDASPDGDATISFDNVDGINATFDVVYDSNVDIYGFQFMVTGVTLIDVTSPIDGLTVSINADNGQVIGFSFGGDSYPKGAGTLASFTFDIGPERTLSFTNVIVSGATGHQEIAEVVGPDVSTGLCDVVDTDGDLWGDSCDNCPTSANFDQADSDADSFGDVCDACPLDADNDIDNDGVCGDVDNCPDIANADQADNEGDTIGDLCDDDDDNDGVLDVDDNCQFDANADQADLENDGLGDVCDSDDDNDTVPDENDICQPGDDLVDSDSDLIPDDCDTCPFDADNDIDNDGVCGDVDNCADVSNPNQVDFDNDGIGDDCDGTPSGEVTVTFANIDGVNGTFDISYDSDVDIYGFQFVVSGVTLIEAFTEAIGFTVSVNPDNGQVIGFSLSGDFYPAGNGTLATISFETGMNREMCLNDVTIAASAGHAPYVYVGPCEMTGLCDLVDTDGDEYGDVCDACPNDFDNDIDADGVCGDVDNCIDTSNPLQEDLDSDGQGDACDADDDNDGIPDVDDNCPTDVNADQADFDSDGQGDICDVDDDNDGVADTDDNCPSDVNPDQADYDGDGQGDVCDLYAGGEITVQFAEYDNTGMDYGRIFIEYSSDVDIYNASFSISGGITLLGGETSNPDFQVFTSANGYVNLFSSVSGFYSETATGEFSSLLTLYYDYGFEGDINFFNVTIATGNPPEMLPQIYIGPSLTIVEPPHDCMDLPNGPNSLDDCGYCDDDPANDGATCAPPTNLTAEGGRNNVTLTWTANDQATYYNVYRDGELVGSTFDASYVDGLSGFGLNYSTEYCYTVTSVYTADNVLDSDDGDYEGAPTDSACATTLPYILVGLSLDATNTADTGVIDLYMTNLWPVYGYQFEINIEPAIVEVANVTGQLSVNYANGVVLGFDFGGGFIAPGENQLLASITLDNYIAPWSEITVTITPVDFSDESATGLNVCDYDFDPTNGCDISASYLPPDPDCMDVPGGEAIVDACGTCAGGTSPNQEANICDGEMVNGTCEGNYSGPQFDDCGVCDGTSFTDFDNDGLSDGCDPYPDGEVYLSFGTNDDSIEGEFGTLEILYDSDVDIYGFQFNLSGIVLESATTHIPGFSVSVNPDNGNVVGFSVSGDYYPSGSDLLTTITYRYDSGDVSTCIGSSIFAGEVGHAPQVWDDACYDVVEPPVDCAGTHNGILENDVCGVCDGPGLTTYCEDTDSDGLGAGTSMDFCPEGTPGFDVPSGWVGNCDDTCPDDFDNDVDNDGVCGNEDNCPDISNPDQADFDNDGIGDLCDDSVGGIVYISFDNVDGIAGTFDVLYDSDVDIYGFQFVINGVDFTGQVEGTVPDFTVQINPENGQVIGFSLTQAVYPAGTGVLATFYFDPGMMADICFSDVTFAAQAGYEPVVDVGECVSSGLCDTVDSDNDLWGDSCDNCPTDGNADQLDSDNDTIGDVCDECPLDSDNDIDTDGVCGDVDNCPGDANSDQSDIDLDGFGDVCDNDDDGDGVADVDDNCPVDANADQADLDEDFIGDVCDDDADGDGILNADDNCAMLANADQADLDGDFIGDVCDDDTDGDGVADVDDNCPVDSNADQADFDSDGFGDACDETSWGDIQLSFVNIDPQLGTFDIAYNSNVDVHGFFFQLTGITVTSFGSSVFTLIVNNNEVTGYSPFGAFLPAGEGILLNVEYVPVSDSTWTCINGNGFEQFYGENNNLLGFDGYCDWIPPQPVVVVDQVIPLNAGWNWFSLYVEDENGDMSLDNLLSTIEGSADFIKGQSQFSSYVDGYGWFGTLQTLDVTNMYMIHVLEDVELVVTGIPVDPAATPIELGAGWNWLGYLLDTPMGINEALASIEGDADFIKNQTQFANYVEGYGWFGTLMTLSPGDGFMIYMINPATLTYPSGDALAVENDVVSVDPVVELVRGEVEWTVDPHAYEFNGSILASVQIDDMITGSENDYLAAFVGDECRGISTGIYNPVTEQIVFPVMIFSNEDNEKITFRYYDSISGTVFGFENNVEFTSDMFAEDISDAIMLTGSYDWDRGPVPTEYNLGAAYPNPFNPVTTLEYSTISEGNVSITVYDITGRVVDVLVDENKEAGNYTVTWNAGSLPSGLYLVRMDSGSFVGIQKVMLVK